MSYIFACRVEAHRSHSTAAQKHQISTTVVHERSHSIHRDGSYLCPLFNVDKHDPDSMSQILTVWSSLPLAIFLPQAKSTPTSPDRCSKTLNYKRRHSIQGDGTYLCPLKGRLHEARLCITHIHHFVYC